MNSQTEKRRGFRNALESATFTVLETYPSICCLAMSASCPRAKLMKIFMACGKRGATSNFKKEADTLASLSGNPNRTVSS